MRMPAAMPMPFAQDAMWGPMRTGPAASGRVLLVALQGAPMRPPAARFGAPPLRPLHVMVVAPGDPAELEAPVSLVSVLPPAPTLRLRSRRDMANGPVPRPVRGELLWSEGGGLYEQVGEEVVPLRAVAAGPRGEILALSPHPKPRTAAPDLEPQESDEDGAPEPLEERAPEDGADVAASAAPARAPSVEPGFAPRCLVRWGDFDAMLREQVEHPERLRASHRLACRARVYEVRRPQRLDALAATILGPGANAARLRVLDEPAAARLGLAGLLRPRRALPPGVERAPGVALPRDLVFHLELESDPTADVAPPEPPQPQVASPGAAATAAPAVAPVSVAMPATAVAPVAAAPGPLAPAPRKTSIPDAYPAALVASRSREEVLYQLALKASSRRGLGAFFAAVRRWFGARREHQRWHALLAGRTPDDQLWAVRPPRGFIGHPALRAWANTLLQAAGYDATMLGEWEIYWRQREP